MANSVLLNRFGPTWPLGSIAVPTPGTGVLIDSLVDPNGIYHSSNGTATGGSDYTSSVAQLTFMAPVGNKGQTYVVMQGAGANVGNFSKTDTGTIVYILQPGQSATLQAVPNNKNVYALEDYAIDADNASDSVQVLAIVA